MKFLTTLLIAFLFIGCSRQHEDPRLKDKDVPLDFDMGIAKDGTYSNKYFGMKFNYNKDWAVQSTDEMNQLLEIGAKAAAGDDKNLKARIEASKVKTAYLFCAFKDAPGTVLGFNPSFIAMAENTSNVNAIKNGEDYLIQMQKMLKTTQLNATPISGIEKRNIGSKPFYVLSTVTETSGMTLYQEYYATVDKGFSLAFIISYEDDEQRAELQEILASTQFQ